MAHVVVTGFEYDVTMKARGIQGIGMTSARTRDRLVQRLEDQGIRSREVLEQIRNVPRHLFVDEALASRAYEDTALPIGHAQTISQPYVVARMTEALLERFCWRIDSGNRHRLRVSDRGAVTAGQKNLLGRAHSGTAPENAPAFARPRYLQRSISPRRRLAGMVQVRAL